MIYVDLSVNYSDHVHVVGRPNFISIMSKAGHINRRDSIEVICKNVTQGGVPTEILDICPFLEGYTTQHWALSRSPTLDD